MNVADWWPIFLLLVALGFGVPEGIAVVRGRGGTLSEWIRRTLRTDTPRGRKTWTAIWSVLAAVVVWLLGHIHNWWW